MKNCIIENCEEPCMQNRRYCHKHFLERKKSSYYKKKNSNVKYRTTYKQICLECGRIFEGWRKEQSFCSKECYVKAMKKYSFHSNEEYLDRTKHNKLAEKVYGRDLTYNEVVHHLNGDVNDNRLENLIVLPRDVHGKLHVYLRLQNILMESSKETWKDDILPLTIKWFSNNKVEFHTLQDILERSEFS